MTGLPLDALDAFSQLLDFLHVDLFQPLDAAQVRHQFVHLLRQNVPADAHLRALTVGDHHPARFFNGLLGYAEQTGFELGGDVRFLVFADHLVKQKRLQIGIRRQRFKDFRVRFCGDAVFGQFGFDVANGVIMIVLEQRFDALDIRLGEENWLALAVQEKAGRVAALTGVELDAQRFGGDYVRAPAIQPDAAHRFAAEHPRRLQDELFVQLHRGFHLIQLGLRNHIRVALVQDFHHIEAVAEQADALHVFQILQPHVPGGHVPHRFDHPSRPHVIALIHGLVFIAEVVKMVRQPQRLHTALELRVRAHRLVGNRLFLDQLTVQFLIIVHIRFVLKNLLLDALFQLVEIDEAALFAHRLFQILESGRAQHLENLHLARFHLVVEPLNGPIDVQIEQLLGGGLFLDDRLVCVRIQRQQRRKVDQRGFRAPLDGLLAVRRQPDAARGNDRHQMPAPAFEEVVMYGPYGMGSDEIVVLVAQPVDVNHIDVVFEEALDFLFDVRQNLAIADHVVFGDFEIAAEQRFVAVHLRHRFGDVADRFAELRMVVNFKHRHLPQVHQELAVDVRIDDQVVDQLVIHARHNDRRQMRIAALFFEEVEILQQPVELNHHQGVLLLGDFHQRQLHPAVAVQRNGVVQNRRFELDFRIRRIVHAAVFVEFAVPVPLAENDRQLLVRVALVQPVLRRADDVKV